MTDAQTSLNGPESARLRLLEAALAHVPFDGWTEATFRAAIADSGVDAALARAVCPRGGLDLAAEWHRQGDRRMVDALRSEPLEELRFRDRVARAVRLRLELVDDKEAVRRGTTLFALPQNAAEGAALIWGTADTIWIALGDTARDLNWYSKRASLSAVYAATVLFWLGDDSPGQQATWDFLDRRIEDIMRIEKAKAALRDNPLGRALREGPGKVLARLRMPSVPDDLASRMADRFR